MSQLYQNYLSIQLDALYCRPDCLHCFQCNQDPPKMSFAVVLFVCLIQVLLARKTKQYIVPSCRRILDIDLCRLQTHCRWSFTLDECLEKDPVYIRGVSLRPVARYAVARPYFSRPVAGYTSRPSFSTFSSRPVVAKSAGVVGSRPTLKHRRR